jgi:hypothetical protein
MKAGPDNQGEAAASEVYQPLSEANHLKRAKGAPPAVSAVLACKRRPGGAYAESWRVCFRGGASLTVFAEGKAGKSGDGGDGEWRRSFTGVRAFWFLSADMVLLPYARHLYGCL